ncbi:MAG: hypothetical protein AB7D51_05230 [Desulfovibrionaceae bacterium]|jgi:hypothetical protein
MYQLVHIMNGKEIPVAVVAKELDARLLQQMHVRSIATGSMEIREMKAAKGK